MFIRAGKAFLRANMSVRKLCACLIKRNDGPIRVMRDTLKMVGENGKTILLLLTFSKIIPLFLNKNY